MARLRLNPLFERQIKQTAEWQASLALETQKVARGVRQAAAGFEHTGAYARSIEVTGHEVHSTDPFAHIIEFGSVHNPPYAPMRRGIRLAGLRLGDVPKP